MKYLQKITGQDAVHDCKIHYKATVTEKHGIVIKTDSWINATEQRSSKYPQPMVSDNHAKNTLCE